MVSEISRGWRGRRAASCSPRRSRGKRPDLGWSLLGGRSNGLVGSFVGLLSVLKYTPNESLT